MIKKILFTHIIALLLVFYYLYFLLKTNDGEFAAGILLIFYLGIILILSISIITSCIYFIEKKNIGFFVFIQFIFSITIIFFGFGILICNFLKVYF